MQKSRMGVQTINSDIKDVICGSTTTLYCPDSYSQTAIPYIVSYLRPINITNKLEELESARVVLFSWAFSWQDVSWVYKVDKPVIIGGAYINSKLREPLPHFDNVSYFFGDIDKHKTNEVRIIPDFTLPLLEDPYQDFLKIYSGTGCNWGRCTFCILHAKQTYRQFNPEYVGKIISLVTSYNKIAGLSAQIHTVDWLLELERYLPNGRNYWCYVRANDSGWNKLQHARDLYIGTEYLSDSVLRRVKKGLTSRQITEAIVEILSCGINVYTNVIEDLWQTQEEREEHYQNMIKLLKKTTFNRKLGAGKLHMNRTALIK